MILSDQKNATSNINGYGSCVRGKNTSADDNELNTSAMAGDIITLTPAVSVRLPVPNNILSTAAPTASPVTYFNYQAIV